MDRKADLFLGNLTAILSICGSVSVKGVRTGAACVQLSHQSSTLISPSQELADISEAEMEYAKSLYQEDYVNGQLRIPLS
jgi:hypothetical protein